VERSLILHHVLLEKVQGAIGGGAYKQFPSVAVSEQSLSSTI
jgi:hypothetical protein